MRQPALETCDVIQVCSKMNIPARNRWSKLPTMLLHSIATYVIRQLVPRQEWSFDHIVSPLRSFLITVNKMRKSFPIFSNFATDYCYPLRWSMQNIFGEVWKYVAVVLVVAKWHKSLQIGLQMERRSNTVIHSCLFRIKKLIKTLLNDSMQAVIFHSTQLKNVALNNPISSCWCMIGSEPF